MGGFVAIYAAEKMKVGRIYEINCRWFRIMRLWSLETVFSKVPSVQGRIDTLKRLKQHCDDVNEVITELKQEMESELWLA